MAADREVEADRQVDLAQQQDERLRHGNRDDPPCLRHQVGDVGRRQEGRLPDLEVGPQDDQADDDGQGAALTSADLAQPDPGVLAQGLGQHLRRGRQRDVGSVTALCQLRCHGHRPLGLLVWQFAVICG
jgi:hypothetical protein